MIYILQTLNFGMEFDSQVLSKTSNDANSIKHLEDKIKQLQNENKQLKDENRTLSQVIKLPHEKKCIAESKSSADNNTNKWEVAKSRRNKTNKNISDSESAGALNKFLALFYS